jgi:hypothetical protein
MSYLTQVGSWFSRKTNKGENDSHLWSVILDLKKWRIRINCNKSKTVLSLELEKKLDCTDLQQPFQAAQIKRSKVCVVHSRRWETNTGFAARKILLQPFDDKRFEPWLRRVTRGLCVEWRLVQGERVEERRQQRYIAAGNFPGPVIVAWKESGKKKFERTR